MRAFVPGKRYIGAVLAPYLMQRGVRVVGLDTGITATGGCITTMLSLRYAANDQQGCAPHTRRTSLDVTR